MSNMYVIGMPEKEEKEIEAKKKKKVFEEIMGKSCKNLFKDINFINFRSSTNPKQDKFKENSAQKHHNQTPKRQR